MSILGIPYFLTRVIMKRSMAKTIVKYYNNLIDVTKCRILFSRTVT